MQQLLPAKSTQDIFLLIISHTIYQQDIIFENEWERKQYAENNYRFKWYDIPSQYQEDRKEEHQSAYVARMKIDPYAEGGAVDHYQINN